MRSDVKQRRSTPGRRIRDETRPASRSIQRMQREYQQNYLADPYAGTPVAEVRDFTQHYGTEPSHFAESSDFSPALRTEPARFEAPLISLPPKERRKKTQRRMRSEISQQDSALQTDHREVLHSESRDVLHPEGHEVLSHDEDSSQESKLTLEPEQRHSKLRFEDEPSTAEDSPKPEGKNAQKKRQRKQSEEFVRESAGQSAKEGTGGQNLHVLATDAGRSPASRSRLRFTAEELTAPISAGADAAVSTAGRTLQHKLAEGQDENAAVEAAGRSIEAGQAAAHSLHGLKLSGKGSEVTSQHSSWLRFSRSAPASKAEGKAAQKAFFKRKFQKQRIRDEYKAALSGVEKVAGTVKGFASRVLEVFTEKKRSIGILVGVLIIALMLSSLLGACGSMLTTAVDAFLQTTWLSEDVDINEADLYYTKLEAELQKKVHLIAATHPGYDEYRYDLDEVGHDPVGLISYLSAEAENGIFVYDSALKDKLEEVFEQQYTLDIQTKLESTTTTRTVRVGESIGRVVTSAYCNCSICCGRWAGGPTASGVYPTSNHTLAVDMYDPIVPMGTKIIMNGRLYKVEDTGYLNRYGVNFDIYMDSHSVAQNWGHKSFEAYLYDANGASEVTVRDTTTKRICVVKLRKKSFDTIAHRNLDPIREEQYKLYCESCGNRQFLAAPSATDWKEHVGGLYGYRWSSSDDISRHDGLDLSLRSGSAVLSVLEGTVKTVGHNSTLGNYVVLQKEKYLVTYGHLRSVSVRQGQSVAVGDTIGRVGSTGNVSEPTLHVNFVYDGREYNPYFYLQNRQISG